MRGLDFQPEMVGRENELKELQRYLDGASEGRGSTLFISGEAGIGKTRLVNELKRVAQFKGFQLMLGNSLHESLTPYAPFIEALRSGGLENLFAEEAPKVEGVYLVTDTGLLVKEVMREETELNPDLFSAMLTTVGDFVKESLSMLSGEERKGALNTLGYENYRILIESGVNTNLVVILTGRENEFLINDMREVLVNVNKYYGSVLKDWDGNEENVAGIDKLLQPIITSGKYDGICYGKDDPKARRNLLFENVSMGLMRQAQTIPTLLCIEDLQWADPSSLALIHYIARNTRKCSLLVLGTYRPEDVAAKEGKSHPLIETMQLMSREDLYEKIELQRLSEENMDVFLSSLLGEIDFSDEFKNRIYSETEGNPLFVIELVKLLVDEEVIKTYNGTWKLAKKLEEVDIPSKIRDVIMRRLNRVEEKHRSILDYACVIGEMFKSTILADALKVERIQLLERLRVLEKTHRLIHSYNGNYKFDHAKIKEVLYSEIPLELRMEYHAIIAGAIETLNKDNLDEVVGDLAFHYYHCKNDEKGLLYLTKAAEKAKKEYSNEEAIRFYNEALEFEEDAQKRMEIFETLGDICYLIGNHDKSIESYNSALGLTEGRKKMAEIKAKIGRIYQRKGEYDESLKICTEALNLVKDEECKEEAFAINYIGGAHWHRGEFDRALDQYEKSLGIREKICDQGGIAQSLYNIGLVHHSSGEYDKALEHYEKSLEIWRKTGYQVGIAISTTNIGVMYFFMGEYDRALEHCEKGLEISEKIGDHWGLFEICLTTAEVYLKKKDLKRALDFCNRAFELSKEFGLKESIADSKITYGKIHREQKKWNKSIENFEESIKIFKEIRMDGELGNSYCQFGLMWKAKGEIEKAREQLNKALDIFEKLKLEKKTKEVRAALESL